MPDQAYKLPSLTRIGHVHLKVRDQKRALEFYCRLLGCKVLTIYIKREVNSKNTLSLPPG